MGSNTRPSLARNWRPDVLDPRDFHSRLVQSLKRKRKLRFIPNAKLQSICRWAQGNKSQAYQCEPSTSLHSCDLWYHFTKHDIESVYDAKLREQVDLQQLNHLGRRAFELCVQAY